MKNKKGFIAISVIYSFFILFIAVMLLIMYSYINDRKISNKVKSDLLNTFKNKAPDIFVSMNGSTVAHLSYDVNVKIIDGGNGIASAKYVWSTSIHDVAVTDLASYNEVLTSPTEPEMYYLIVTACDINSNCKTVVTNPFNVDLPFICLKATALHNDTCTNSDPDNYCLGYGIEANDTTVFGRIQPGLTPAVGSAYDCDVNGDGEYDPINERFYYISDYYDANEKKYDKTIATLVYSANVHNGVPTLTNTSAYTTGNDYVPSNIYSELPTTTQWSNVSLEDSERTISSESGNDITTSFEYTGEPALYTVPVDGTYKIELWGASGGEGWTNAGGLGYCNGGNGSYTSGTIELEQGEQLYFYVGEKGADGGPVTNNYRPASFNGGGAGGFGGSDDNGGVGGGATDVRLVNGNWDDFDSIKSRIMVAAGGGGGNCVNHSSYTNISYRNGGNLFIESTGVAAWNRSCTITEVNQTQGGAFGAGLNSYDYEVGHASGGGGGGYYGGTYCNSSTFYSGGSGGVSFVSGFPGCDSISPLSTADNIIHTGFPIHYSGKGFLSVVMKSGSESMPDYDGEGNIIGNVGNGFARITLISAPTETQINNTFTYTDKAARILNYKEALNCIKYKTIQTDNNIDFSVGKLKNECNFLLENTKFNASSRAEGFFIENPYSSNDYIWVLNSSDASIYGGILKSTNNKYGVRPVIDVPKVRIER